MFDFHTINNNLSVALIESERVEEYLAHLGCSVEPRRRGATTMRANCPVHCGDDRNFSVYLNGHTLPLYWRCHSHVCHKKVKPSLLGLVRGALTGDPDKPGCIFKARTHVEDFLGKPVDLSARWTPAARRAYGPKTYSRAAFRRRFVIPSPYFISRGFDPAVLTALDVGDYPGAARAMVPLFDDTGTRLVAYHSRSFFPKCGACKYSHPVDRPCAEGKLRWKWPDGFNKGAWLYNYASVRSSPCPYVLLVEGVPEVFRAVEAGVPAVAGFGVDLTPEQQIKLELLGKRVVVAFDNDEVGRPAAVVVARQLKHLGGIVCHPPEGYKDIGEMPASLVASWIREEVEKKWPWMRATAS